MYKSSSLITTLRPFVYILTKIITSLKHTYLFFPSPNSNNATLLHDGQTLISLSLLPLLMLLWPLLLYTIYIYVTEIIATKCQNDERDMLNNKICVNIYEYIYIGRCTWLKPPIKIKASHIDELLLLSKILSDGRNFKRKKITIKICKSTFFFIIIYTNRLHINKSGMRIWENPMKICLQWKIFLDAHLPEGFFDR